MRLKNYIKATGKTVTEFAREVGCSQSHMWLICNGLRRPSPDLARKISDKTDGKIAVLELLFENRNAA